METVETDLVSRARRGDVASFEALVDLHYADCLRFAQRMLSVREDAEEAVQDTFIRAYRSLLGYDEREKFRGWLFRILVNRCRSALNKRNRRGPLLAAYARWNGGDMTSPRIAEALAARSAIDTALAQLPSDQREAFLLRHLEELSYNEMSAMTGLGESALKMRVKRACDRLREILTDE